MPTAHLIREPVHGTEFPLLCCPGCGDFVELDPRRGRCRCGWRANWNGRILDCMAEEDGFYEGKYNAEIHFDLARLARPAGRLLLHFLVYGYYESILRFVPRGARILDVGCAGGADLLAQWGRVTGLDVSFRAAAAAARRYPCVIRGDVRRLNFAPGSFDAIVSSFVWEHLEPEEKDLLLENFRCWLRPGGKVVLALDVESRNPLFQWARRRPELFQQAFIDHDGHCGLETASAALKRFSNHGFLIRRRHAMNRTPLQHLPVWGWFGPYGKDYPALRFLTKLGDAITSHRTAHRAYTGGVQLLDDTLGRLLPEDWSRLLLVVLEKPEPVRGKPGLAGAIKTP